MQHIILLHVIPIYKDIEAGFGKHFLQRELWTLRLIRRKCFHLVYVENPLRGPCTYTMFRSLIREVS